jgi:hypothetical protein
MITQKNQATDGSVFSEFNDGNFIPGTNTGATIFIPRLKGVDFSAILSAVIQTFNKGNRLLFNALENYRQRRYEKTLARWYGPTPDAEYKLEQTKVSLIKQAGYH